jgi:hypothetical protein
MKKSGVLFLISFALSLLFLNGVLAEGCDLEVSMINQDPYPAIPGSEVKIVFQIDGIENVECEDVEFELVEKYPISIFPGEQIKYEIESGTFKKDFKSFFLAPYRVFVSEDAIDGDMPIEVRYRSSKNLGHETKSFDLNIEDTKADFEVHIKDYNYETKILTLEILNIVENDAEALTIEIPKQNLISITGSNKNIVGDLDSNDYTTAEFKATPKDGTFEILIHYSDEINERRVISKEVTFDSNYFQPEPPKKTPISTYIIIGTLVLLIILWIINKRKKRKELEAKLKSRR